MKKILFLHIGSHKTGTTALQISLHENRGYLKKLNLIDIRSSPPSAINNGGAIGKVYKYKKAELRGYGARIGPNAAAHILKTCNACLLEALAREPQECINLTDGHDLKFVFSSENLSWIFRREEIESFIDGIQDYFDAIKVILYCRAQDSQLRAHHRQGAFDPLARLFYGNEAGPDIAIHKHFDLYLDYYQRISTWVDVLGSENVSTRVFDRSSLAGGDITLDFLEFVNIPFEASNLRLKANANMMSKVQEKTLRLFQDAWSSSSIRSEWQQHKYLKSKIMNLLSKQNYSPSPTPSETWREQVLSRYEESNSKLSNQFSLGHSWYKYKPSAAIFSAEWTEEEASFAIKQLLRFIIKQEVNRKSGQSPPESPLGRH